MEDHDEHDCKSTHVREVMMLVATAKRLNKRKNAIFETDAEGRFQKQQHVKPR